MLGTVLVETKDTERAIAELETARAGLPEEPKVYFQLGRAYAAAGRAEDAAHARAEFARLTRMRQASGAKP
jgi:predicted Zn-dependent protease